ncbi:MAG: hypothetical protein DIU67_003615 [Actinomycetes bacterium]|jgi:hypothetical protein|nr:MAG: hypothetical protein DIU67_00915 [Actinomycetota bacterium]
MTKTAQLRVYSPTATPSVEPVPGFVREFGMLSEPADRDLTATWEGRLVVCPSHLRLRVLESTVAYANAVTSLGVSLVPERAARIAIEELRRYHADHPDHRSHVLTAAWHVPIRWFALFDPAEREVYDGPRGPVLRYRAGIETARKRLRRATRILEATGMFRGPVEDMAHLQDWLEPFPEGSMVELDYGGVAEMFDPADVILDDTCELLQESLDALAGGDMLRAGELYGRVVARWGPVFSVTFSN